MVNLTHDFAKKLEKLKLEVLRANDSMNKDTILNEIHLNKIRLGTELRLPMVVEYATEAYHPMDVHEKLDLPFEKQFFSCRIRPRN